MLSVCNRRRGPDLLLRSRGRVTSSPTQVFCDREIATTSTGRLRLEETSRLDTVPMFCRRTHARCALDESSLSARACPSEPLLARLQRIATALRGIRLHSTLRRLFPRLRRIPPLAIFLAATTNSTTCASARATVKTGCPPSPRRRGPVRLDERVAANVFYVAVDAGRISCALDASPRAGRPPSTRDVEAQLHRLQPPLPPTPLSRGGLRCPYLDSETVSPRAAVRARQRATSDFGPDTPRQRYHPRRRLGTRKPRRVLSVYDRRRGPALANAVIPVSRHLSRSDDALAVAAASCALACMTSVYRSNHSTRRFPAPNVLRLEETLSLRLDIAPTLCCRPYARHALADYQRQPAQADLLRNLTRSTTFGANCHG
ncbi:hypothetical protein R3P38DRAFT_3193199 [Favolaschia claudopus]|uniref:Uncharacterized protein n=1 Tax=Favolaschia claudopus TaxID=2862362 RepID=A0AAW0BHV0_9AGAR